MAALPAALDLDHHLGKQQTVSRSRPTMKEVAEHAKVSLSTVSYVVNNSGPVAADRRARVLAAVRELADICQPLKADLDFSIKCQVNHWRVRHACIPWRYFVCWSQASKSSSTQNRTQRLLSVIYIMPRAVLPGWASCARERLI